MYSKLLLHIKTPVYYSKTGGRFYNYGEVWNTSAEFGTGGQTQKH